MRQKVLSQELLRPLNEMKLALEFAGGMELLFANQRELEVDLPGDSTAVNVKTALAYIRDCVLVDTARADMFMKGSTIRPGVLVLINDVDWELTGTEESGTCGDGDDGDGDDAVWSVLPNNDNGVTSSRRSYTHPNAELEDGDKLAFISTLHGG